MKKRRVRVGLAPTRRCVFSVEDAHRYKKLVEDKLRPWKVDFVDIDSVNRERLLFNKGDALAAKPFLLWGPGDEAPLPNGRRLRDTQCGLFATGYVLQRYRVAFSYIVNNRVDKPVFEREFKNFLCAARAVNAFLGAKVGQVSTGPANFYTVIVNEGKLGALGGVEEEDQLHESEIHAEARYTDPRAFEDFVKRTGVDSLTVSIGTSHGMVKMKGKAAGTAPSLRFNILDEIARRVPGFLVVLHGASALPREHLDMISAFGG